MFDKKKIAEEMYLNSLIEKIPAIAAERNNVKFIWDSETKFHVDETSLSQDLIKKINAAIS